VIQGKSSWLKVVPANRLRRDVAAEMRTIKMDFLHRNIGGGLTARHDCPKLSYMRATLTISLPPGLRRDVSRAARNRRMSESEFVRNAVQRQLWIEAFEETRRQAVPRARAAGIYTDEDVFRIVS
jgi:Arc/MetJ-type ribon-helix-helix transcriptional regulator